MGWIVAVPFLAFAWFVSSSASDETKAKAALSDETQKFEIAARVSCASRISDDLRNPASVEWDQRHFWPVVDNGDGLYIVTARFRAENGFGGMVKETRQCLVARSERHAAVLGIE